VSNVVMEVVLNGAGAFRRAQMTNRSSRSATARCVCRSVMLRFYNQAI
jgi:hypothetical protein